MPPRRTGNGLGTLRKAHHTYRNMPTDAASTAHMALSTVSRATTGDTRSKASTVEPLGDRSDSRPSTRESFCSSSNSTVRMKNVSPPMLCTTASGRPISSRLVRRLPWSTLSENSTISVEPPVKSIPGLRPGARIRNTTPGRMTTREMRKNQPLLPAKSNCSLLYAAPDGICRWGSSPPPVGTNTPRPRDTRVVDSTLKSVLLTVMAENMLTSTPMARVAANP